MSGATRRLAYQFGHWAETLCVWWLRLRGYRVLARDTLAFVEVKARHEGSKDDASEVLTTHQRGRITRAA